MNFVRYSMMPLLLVISAWTSAQYEKSLPGKDLKRISQEQIQPLVKFCESCHGSGGQSTRADIPSIAGKREDYILVSLEQYFYYERSCPDVEFENMDGELETLSMCKVTSQVNKQQALALGRYFAAQSSALLVQEE